VVAIDTLLTGCKFFVHVCIIARFYHSVNQRPYTQTVFKIQQDRHSKRQYNTHIHKRSTHVKSIYCKHCKS
jgi:hypothetical protein